MSTQTTTLPSMAANYSSYSDNVHDDDGDEYNSISIQWFVNIMQGFRYDFWYYINMLFIILVVAIVLYYLFFRKSEKRIVVPTIVNGGGGFESMPSRLTKL